MTSSDPVLFFDEVVVGDEAVTPGRTITEADVVRYAQLSGDYDPRAVDVEFARANEFGRVVPDLLVPVFSSGLSWRIPRLPLAIMAFMGLEWQFFKPIRIGDTVSLRLRATAKRKMKEVGVVI